MREGESPTRTVGLGPYIVELSVGDVAEQAGRLPVVSSDDNYLSHGGGVSAAIWRAVGSDLQADPAVATIRDRGERPSLAHVVVSRVGSEQVPVFHAITIDFDLGERLSPRDLGMLYTNLLNAADDQGVERIVLPLIGAGAGHVGASGTIAALLDVVRSRSLLSSGQRLTVLVLPRALADAQQAFDHWLERNPDVLVSLSDESAGGARAQRTDWSAETPIQGLIGPSSISGSIGHWGGQPTEPRREPTSRSRGRWERLAREQPHPVEEVILAAQALDVAPNARASGPAMRLWGLLDSAPETDQARPAELRQVLEIARSARNRIAHGAGDQTALLPELMRGIEVLLDPGSARETIEHSSPILVGGVRADWSREGTQHVRLLHDLLRTSLSPVEIDSESDRLGALGYQGKPADRLLENCVADDPLDVLQRHFSGSDLRRLLDERGIPTRASDSPRDLARRLLHHLGFPRRDELVDPDVARSDVKVLASELHGLSQAQLTGRIAGISRSLEAILRTYLRFLTKGFLDKSPDIWLDERRRARPNAPLPASVDRLTFGQLTRLIGAVGKEITKSRDARTLARVDDMRGTSARVEWLPDGIEELVDQRNVWVHGAAEESRVSLSTAEMRQQAREFCQLALRILDGLIDGPFPSVIVIEEIGFDTWGRRHVRAKTSKGTVESIFTDLDLIPGQTYLMHARTNPLRVDPLLVRQAVAHEEEDR